MTRNSKLGVKLNITESIFDSTNIREELSAIVIPATLSIKKDIIKSGSTDRLTNYGTYSATKDTYVYLKNIGDVNFDVRSASDDAGIFGTLLPNDFIFVRMKKGLDIYVKNLGNGDGEIEIAYWQSEETPD